MYVVAIVIAALDNELVSSINLGLVGKLGFKEFQRCFHRTVEQPAHQTERKHVATFHLSLQVHAGILESLFHHSRDRCLNDLSGHTEFFVRFSSSVKCLVQT